MICGFANDLREVGALPAYASGEGSGVEVTKDGTSFGTARFGFTLE